MSVALQEILTLAGRLDDAPGFDTPRERFRRFLTEHITDVAGVRSLLGQSQQGLGDQYARARHDLIVLLGVFLGFEVTFGGYEAPGGGPLRLGGHWRSRRRARIVLDVRSEQTAGGDVDELANAVKTMATTAPGDADERWFGLCVTTPFYTARHRLETLLAQRQSADIRCVTVESLLWLADMTTSDRLTHEDVVRILMSSPDSDFMIDLMRRMATSGTPSPSPPAPSPAGPISADRDAALQSEAPVHLSIVERSDRAREQDCWLASLASDETSSAEQLVDFVIRERHLLGVTDTGPLPTPVHEGDWVCFYIEDIGIVGHAQFDSAISDASAVIGGGRRFTAVFQLKNVIVYEMPNPVIPESIGVKMPGRMPYDSGAVLARISQSEFYALTAGASGQSGWFGIRE